MEVVNERAGEMQQLLQESKRGAQRAAEQNARLQSKLLAVERELLHASTRVTAMQSKHLKAAPRKQQLAGSGDSDEEELPEFRPVPTFIVGYEQPRAGW
jgi:hypothetical protein